MIVSLTGHTKGLGNAIFNKLNKTYQIKGLSRSNGWDIKDVDSIIAEVRDTDVFINNAYSNRYQSELFIKLFYEWKYTNKIIININSSMVIDGNSNSDYYHNKVNLKKVVDTAISDTQNKTVRIMNLFPSTLSTNYYYKNLNKIDNNYIASLIEWVLKQPSDIELRDVIIYPSERENFKKTLL